MQLSDQEVQLIRIVRTVQDWELRVNLNAAQPLIVRPQGAQPGPSHPPDNQVVLRCEEKKP